MELQVGVKIILKNEAGKILLLERNLQKYPEVPKENRWDIVGGRIKPGVSLIDSLKREVLEETKLELRDEPKLLAAQDILRLADKHVVRLTYIANVEGEPKLDSEHESYKWVSLEELGKLDDLDIYFKEVFNKYLKHTPA